MSLPSLSAFLIVLLIWGEPGRLALNRIVGIGPAVNDRRGVTIKVLALLVVFALVLVIDPEISAVVFFCLLMVCGQASTSSFCCWQFRGANYCSC